MGSTKRTNSVAEVNFVNPNPDRKKRPIQNTLIDCRYLFMSNPFIFNIQSFIFYIYYILNTHTIQDIFDSRYEGYSKSSVIH